MTSTLDDLVEHIPGEEFSIHVFCAFMVLLDVSNLYVHVNIGVYKMYLIVLLWAGQLCQFDFVQ